MGHGGDSDAMFKMLAQLERLNTTVEAMQSDVGDLKTGLRAVKDEVSGVNRRLDHLIEFVGDRHRDHESRIRALEDKVGDKH